MTWVQVIFVLLALVAVGSALLVVTTRNMVHAALWLVVTLGAVAGVYLMLAAEFLAWVQVLIYVGAVVVLLLFALMLTKAPTGPQPDLDTRRAPLHVAIQNWEHDFNIGSVVRTANAFNVAGVHILGRRRWNRRGAMVTDRYLHIHHHETVAGFVSWLAERGITPVGVDNLPGSVPLETAALPRDCCVVFGSEGPGLTDEVVAACESVVAITQYGSTRSMNAGAAAAIAMYHWALQHAGGKP